MLKYNNLYLVFGLGDLKNKKERMGNAGRKQRRKQKWASAPAPVWSVVHTAFPEDLRDLKQKIRIPPARKRAGG